MRLLTFLSGGRSRIGAETAHGIVDFQVAAPALPHTMLTLLSAGAEAMESAHQAVARALRNATGLIAAEQAQPLAPIPRPGKILAIGFNYRDHAAETGTPIPAAPVVFSKACTAVIGPGAAIEIPPASAMVDYEGELAVVIGTRAKRVARHEALRYVAGYTIMNDVSARDYQRRSGHCIAKSFDTFAPMGPVLVTADEIPDPSGLDLRTVVSGDELQASNTGNLIFDVPTLIEYISAGVTLEPGDLISTGTPGGVGFRRTPPRFLRAGDVVRIEISGIGALENPVISAAAQQISW